MNIQPMIKFFNGLLHKKGSVTPPDEFQELLTKTKGAILKSKEVALTLNPKEYFVVKLDTEMENLGVALTCLDELLIAMSSEGDAKYIDVPTFNRGFFNVRGSSLDRLLIDSNGQWINFAETLDNVERKIGLIETQLSVVDSKMLDYYKGHSRRIISRVYNIFKQL